MSYICNALKLPMINNYEILKCIKICMGNGEEYTIKQNDLVGIQFVKDDKRILVRRGRIKDIVLINRRQLSTVNDNVSYIVLDCSEQFSIKIIEIKLKDIIKIGKLDEEFPDYSDRITELEPNFLDQNQVKVPTRHGGMITKEELTEKITKPERENVSKMNPCTGEFDDLYEMNQYRPAIDELKSTNDELQQRCCQGATISNKGFKLTK